MHSDLVLAGKVVQQCLDPNGATLYQFPDENTRPSYVIRAGGSTSTLTSFADGTLGLVISPWIVGGIYTTVVNYAGWTASNNPSVHAASELFRVLSVRVQFLPTTTSAQTAGVVQYWCGGGIFPSERTASTTLAGLVDGVQTFDMQACPVFCWKPSGVKSFGYARPALAFANNVTDDKGGLAYQIKPSMHFQFLNVSAATVFSRFHTTIVYEVIPDQSATGSLLPRSPSTSNRMALDLFIGAMRQLTFAWGNRSNAELSSYAARVRDYMMQPEIARGVLDGGVPLAVLKA